MRRQSVVLRFVLLMALLLAACSPAAETQDAMMEPTATMMDEMMEETPIPMTGDGTPDGMMEETPDDMMDPTGTPEMMDETPDAMMDETPDAMMDSTGTPDDMMDEMMDSTATPDPMMMETPDAMMDSTATPDAMMGETPGADMMAPAWVTAQLTDQASGETFAIEEFKGKVVLVNLFAQDCSACRQQQEALAMLHEMLGMPADLVTVTLDVDPAADAAMLQEYAQTMGYDWRFAVAPADVVGEFGELYGEAFTGPDSSPTLIIDRQGEAHPLPAGVKTAEELQAALEPYLNEGM